MRPPPTQCIMTTNEARVAAEEAIREYVEAFLVWQLDLMVTVDELQVVESQEVRMAG